MGDLSKTDRDWIDWSVKNPYYGVLGYETKGISGDAQASAFFETGEKHISDVLDVVGRHFSDFRPGGAALDFGCGVGRLLRPLAKRFDRVVGVDIAPKMLEAARENTNSFGNVALIESRQLDTLSPSSFDLVHTYIVLQHIRPEQGMKLIERLARLVRPGGCCAFHFTVGDRKRGRRLLNWVRYRMPPVHLAYNVLRSRPWNEPMTEMHKYDVSEVLFLLQSLGFPRAIAVASDHGGHGGVMLLAQRAGAHDGNVDRVSA